MRKTKTVESNKTNKKQINCKPVKAKNDENVVNITLGNALIGSKDWFETLSIAGHRKHLASLRKDAKIYLGQVSRHLAAIKKLQTKAAKEKIKARNAKLKAAR